LLVPPLLKSLNSPAEAAPAETPSAPEALPPLPSVKQEEPRPAIDYDAETQRRVERLRQQLDQLRHHLSERRTETVPAEPPAPKAHEAAPSKESDPHSAPHSEAPDHQVESVPSTDSPEVEHGAQEPNVPATEPHPPTAPPSKAASLIKGLPASSTDRVSIADNLFAAGEIVTAAQIYREIQLKELSRSESGWVRFQIANCHRRLGQTEDARKIYRRLVAEPALGWLQDMSKWWLDALDQRDALLKDQQRIHELVQQAERVKHAASNP
jgi:hypothetical protein